jgi:hypothetical protein
MKTFAIVIALTLNFYYVCRAQLAIINDPDGFVNVREGKSSKTKAIGKFIDGQIFLCDDENPKSEWVWVSFTGKDFTTFNAELQKHLPDVQNGQNTFVNRSHILFIGSLPKINTTKIRSTKSGKLTLKNDTISLTIETTPFDKKKHKIEANAIRIDDKGPWGVDGYMPTIGVSNITFTINQKAVEIPTIAFDDLYQPTIENLKIYFDKKGRIYLYMPGNSDGAGYYDVVWVVKNGKLLYRYVDSID